ncbi:hypothetical protein OS493_015495 [Desmophyllum pertusum]|uniref:Uncharacterized protein n=1 Tax=Desmophyllum pertusum TaxID=174260 RepID=A0A9W9Z0F9_9CNID|nr:hypothetical protein OS493_015495 [Desmophyllum pertusum]
MHPNSRKLKQDGQYGTLHPGEWKAWSPCSTPCGPDGRQSRSRSCLIYPSIFDYSTDGYDLTESRECNIGNFPCEQGSCKAFPIILNNDNLTSFSIPFNASILPDDPTEEQQSLDEQPPVWCFNDSVASYLELNFTVAHHICAIETQGMETLDGEAKYISSYLFEVYVEDSTANYSEWKFYNRSGNLTKDKSPHRRPLTGFIDSHLACAFERQLYASELYGEPIKFPDDAPKKFRLSQPVQPHFWYAGIT